MIYKITDKTLKEWQGKKFVQATLTDTDGIEYENIGAWNGEFDDREKWEGELTKTDKGYWKIVLPKKSAGTNYKNQQIKEVMDTKRQDISRSMDRKEESIILAGAQRDAVLCAIAEQNADIYMKDTPAPLDQQIIKWRNWFLSDEFRSPPPF